MEKLKGSITISRPSYGDGIDRIAISIVDNESRIKFLEIEIDPAHMMMALTGMSFQEIDFQVRGLENVGKKKETLPMTLVIHHCSREAAEDYLRNFPSEILSTEQINDGWKINQSLRSQSSISYANVPENYMRIIFSIYRYI